MSLRVSLLAMLAGVSVAMLPVHGQSNLQNGLSWLQSDWMPTLGNLPAQWVIAGEGSSISITGSDQSLLLHGELILHMADGFGPTGLFLGAGAGDSSLVDGIGSQLIAEIRMAMGSTPDTGWNSGGEGHFTGQDIVLGEQAGSSGYLYLNHGNATARHVTVGQAGSGFLHLGTNGWLELHGLEVAKLIGSTGNLNVNGGQVHVLTDAFIGAAGHGQLNIENSGQFEVGHSRYRGQTVMGAQPTGYGNLHVTGAASRAVLGETIIGQSGTGVLEVSNEGYIRTEGNATIGSGSSASIRDRGSRWEVTESLITAPGGSLILTDGGVITVQRQVLFEVGSLAKSTFSSSASTSVPVSNMLAAASITNRGRLDVLNSLTLDTPLVVNKGIIAIGEAGHEGDVWLRITGNLIQTESGTIQMTLQRSGDVGYLTLMEIDGTLTAAGIFELTVYDSYLVAGQTIPLIRVHGDLMGDFSQTLLNNGSDLQLDLAWQGTTLVAHVVPEPSTWILMGLGFAGVIFYIRKRKLL